MRSSSSKIFVLLYVLCSIALLAVVSAAPELPQLSATLDPNSVTVSGLSSGAFMAVQMQFAFSSTVKGAGIVAGGPYWCAKGSVADALTNCMKKYSCDFSLNVNPMVEEAKQQAKAQNIDPIENLQKHKIYLFSGTKDTIVDQCVMKKLQDMYKDLGVNLSTQALVRFDLPSEHAMITDNYGNGCDHNGSPYINNCKYSSAGQMLQHMYGQLQPAAQQPVASNLLTYSQEGFIRGGSSMDSQGFVYIPSKCQPGAGAQKNSCKLHVVFHGCQQYRGAVGSVFAEHAGYLEYAETNNIVVLFPQATNSFFAPSNPNGCWDWWGYTDSNYHTKKGVQMQAVAKMISHILGSQ